ncbi:(2Fe-2S)-binding protein [Virgibacillus doumboii]|uniref:(2Fe-2S)-binding protein n=1 Tax=Virgibacillus doumboii TaxID=2697503 RepID=UPI0013E02AA2|nr:(2Fe-2S)-binding protein [Virgibacillus doumboii]
MTEDVVICRCEEVMLSEIEAAIESGTTAKAIKLKTRAGMGICQGRTCRPLIEQAVSYYKQDMEGLTFAEPVRPLTLAELVGEGKELE